MLINSNWLGGKTKLTSSILCLFLLPSFSFLYASFVLWQSKSIPFVFGPLIRENSYLLSSLFFICPTLSSTFFERSSIAPKQFLATIFFIISYLALFIYLFFFLLYLSIDLLLFFILTRLNPKLNHQRGQSYVIDSVYRFVKSTNQGMIVIPTFSHALFNSTFNPPARLARY